MPSPSPLQLGVHYHIYNRGTNREDVFLEARNYHFFLNRYATYIEPIAFTYAYCLLKNHFHFLIRTKTLEEQQQVARQTARVSGTFRVLAPSQQFSNLFNSYAKSFNRAYDRTGSLFEHPFHRVAVTTDEKFAHLITYIHRNPERHAFVDDFQDWPYSSYHAILSQQPTRIMRETVLDWFDGRVGFMDAHGVSAEVESIAGLVLE